MSTVTQPSAAAMQKLGQIAHGFIGSSALNAIARLGVADLLHPKPLTIDELAKQTSTNKDALGRVMRFLCSIGIFEEVSPDKFANNDASELMREDVAGSQRDLLLFLCDPFHMKAYADMLPTIRDGKTGAYHVWGKEIFEVFAENKEEQILFDNAMTNISKTNIETILDAFDFSDISKLVDVAGGHGALLTGILRKYPSMRGVLFELPHVAPGAKENIAKLNLADRCEVVDGDFFKSVPSGDAIIMKHIIHDWDDDRAVTILKNCKEAGVQKVLLVELLLAETNEPEVSRFMDIEMLMMPGGRERTEKQFAELFARAGMKLNRVVRTKSPSVVLEGVPA
jgi:hypothetical protein